MSTAQHQPAAPRPAAYEPPTRSLDQRMTSLRYANEIRTARAQLKRDLKAGRRTVDELLLAHPEYIDSMKVYDLLIATPKYGRVKVNKVLQVCRISPSKTIGGMSARQRLELAAMLRR